MKEQALAILRQGLDRLGLTYPPDAVERLALYGDRLLEKDFQCLFRHSVGTSE